MTMKNEQKFGLTIKKEEDFSEWYSQVVVKSEMIDYYDIRGCYIMRPLSFFMWNEIKNFFTKKIEQMGVEECYFPMLVTKTALEREKNHIENFSPEVAWISKCGDSNLEASVAIRPTSETIMYPSFAKWLKSHRDLPLKVNQWCNILRWEIKGTLPFIRGREFLWQEGHTAHLNKSDADKEVLEILDLYAEVYESLLAVPVVKGKKSKNETFGGADYTTTIEVFIPGSGRGIQAATSHCLGTNFSQMFDIKVNIESASKEAYVYQNSWGLTTRTLGIATMIHSDNKGFVAPPRVSMVQVIIVPCGISVNTTEEDKAKLLEYISNVENVLKSGGIRVKSDLKENVTPGYKFNYWEIKGVPIRMEIGFKDMAKREVKLVRRFDSEKLQIEVSDVLNKIKDELNYIHETMLENARKERKNRTKNVESWDEFINALNDKNLVLAPWCSHGTCEDDIKTKSTVMDKAGNVVFTGAKSLCIPFEGQVYENKKCVNCGLPARSITLFGRSY